MPVGRKRHDPVVKAADGRRNYDRIGGKDPARHYVLTNPNDEETGTAHYVNQLGYVVEHVRAGGPASAASYQGEQGAKVTSGGQILVSAPMDHFETRVSDGQALAGVLEDKILKRGGIEDALRGQTYEMGARFERGERREAYASEET